ncbi:P-loop NTPase family protein [Desulforhopalus sp. 52FAK]
MARVTLISVDGIPGSGKSSTVHWLGEMLAKKGKSVQIVAEDSVSHPVRYLTDLQKPLAPWNEMSAEKFSSGCLNKFARFINNQTTIKEQRELIIVLDGLLFHTDTTSYYLMQPGEEQLRHHLRELVKIGNRVSFLPLLLYHQPFGSSISMTMNSRPDEWSSMQIDWKTSSPYCRRKGYTGNEGYIQFYQGYEEWMTNTFNRLFEKTRRSFSACNPQADWLSTRKAMWSFYSKNLLRPSYIEKLL